jgi:hypothetical protein
MAPLQLGVAALVPLVLRSSWLLLLPLLRPALLLRALLYASPR